MLSALLIANENVDSKLREIGEEREAVLERERKVNNR